MCSAPPPRTATRHTGGPAVRRFGGPAIRRFGRPAGLRACGPAGLRGRSITVPRHVPAVSGPARGRPPRAAAACAARHNPAGSAPHRAAGAQAAKGRCDDGTDSGRVGPCARAVGSRHESRRPDAPARQPAPRSKSRWQAVLLRRPHRHLRSRTEGDRPTRHGRYGPGGCLPTDGGPAPGTPGPAPAGAPSGCAGRRAAPATTAPRRRADTAKAGDRPVVDRWRQRLMSGPHARLRFPHGESRR
jgi:hypothetical protein